MISAKDAHETAEKANEKIIKETIEYFEDEICRCMEKGYFSFSEDVYNSFVRKAVMKYFKKLGYKVSIFWETVRISW